MKMNLPNKLSVMRLFMVPVFVVVMMASDALWANLVGCALFGLAAITDLLDGIIARKYNLVTDFGKFMDPLADKFMVIGALLVILSKVMGDGNINSIFTTVYLTTVMLVIFRELAVTSIRLVVSSSSGVVVAANILGKVKTWLQSFCVLSCILERAIYASIPNPHAYAEYLPFSLFLTVAMLVITLWSGINYLASYWKYMDPEK